MSSYAERQPTTSESEDDAVLTWRFDQLCGLGFDDVEAVLLAYSDLDLHRVRTLVAAGCPLQLAAEIAL